MLKGGVNTRETVYTFLLPAHADFGDLELSDVKIGWHYKNHSRVKGRKK